MRIALPWDCKLHARRANPLLNIIYLLLLTCSSWKGSVSMIKNLLLKSELSRWFASPKRFSTQRQMADAMGIPYDTLRNYFKGKSPGPENARRLSEITGLDLSAIRKATGPKERGESKDDLKRLEYASRLVEDLHFEMARCLAALVPARKVLIQHVRDGKTAHTKGAQAIQLLMDALQRSLEPYLEDPDGLVILRQAISGSDAGYLSGLLGSIFDDRRLQRWRDMTTYKYGSK